MSELAEPGLAGKPDGHGLAHNGAHQGHGQGAHGTFDLKLIPRETSDAEIAKLP